MRKGRVSSKGKSYLGGRLTRREVTALIGGGVALAAGEIPVLSLPARAGTIRPAAIPRVSRRPGPVSIAAMTQADHMRLASLRIGLIELNRSVLPHQRGNDGPAFRPAGPRQPERIVGPNSVSEAEKKIHKLYVGPLPGLLFDRALRIVSAAVFSRFLILAWFDDKLDKVERVTDPLMGGELGKGDEDPVSGRSVEAIRNGEEQHEEASKRKLEREEYDRLIERLRRKPLDEQDRETRSEETRGGAGAGEREPKPHFRIDVY